MAATPPGPIPIPFRQRLWGLAQGVLLPATAPRGCADATAKGRADEGGTAIVCQLDVADLCTLEDGAGAAAMGAGEGVVGDGEDAAGSAAVIGGDVEAGLRRQRFDVIPVAACLRLRLKG